MKMKKKKKKNEDKFVELESYSENESYIINQLNKNFTIKFIPEKKILVI
jgi:hypothetical protein